MTLKNLIGISLAQVEPDIKTISRLFDAPKIVVAIFLSIFVIKPLLSYDIPFKKTERYKMKSLKFS
jgi:hypothetical protein